MSVVVFAEQKSSLEALCQSVQSLGDKVEAIVIGDAAAVKGAAKVWSIPAQAGVMVEDYTDSIIAFAEKEKPALIVFEPTRRCKVIAGRLAAALKTSVLTDVIAVQDGVTERMVYGGAAIQKEKATGATAIAMIGASVFEAQDVAAGSETGAIDFVAPKVKLTVVSVAKKEVSQVNLPAAKKVVAVGRGFAKEEEIGLAKDLAAAIGGEVACSRPIAEGEGWMPKETYVGVSGLMLAPDVYLAIGISGQVQHMVGANRAKTIIAINKDKNAPIFQLADYGLVADLTKVLPAITAKLK